MGIFNNISLKKPKSNKFDLSHEVKMSGNMGKLLPILCSEVIPGDKFRVNSEIMMRYAPMLAPIMHRVNVFTHYFFVPNRLIHNEWEDFITGGREGTSQPVLPYLTLNDANMGAGHFGFGSLADYLGVPQTPSESILNPLNISALPFRAYQMIYNEYYRDQNVQAPVEFGVGSGNANADIVALAALRDRAWEKDYFTSALPWAQRGNAVTVPVSGESDLITYLPISKVYDEDGNAPTAGQLIGNGSTIQDDLTVGKSGVGVNGEKGRIENIDTVSFSDAEFSINELRRSIKLQEWLEKNARGGARYIEQILSHFGVTSSDARLQRPEYLGGGKAPTVISEVLSTVNNAEDSQPLGNMGGHAISIGRTNGFNKRFEEHGYIIGIMSVLPRTGYQQGVPRHFLRQTKLDFAWPEFAHLGEQEVFNSELYLDQDAANHRSTFGYQSRYAEYKFMPSRSAGDFKSSLQYWHMNRIFTAPPVLNESFIKSNPTERIFAVEGEDLHHLYCQIYHNVSALRPLPYFGTPTI